jgi:uncharacterized protein YxjI
MKNMAGLFDSSNMGYVVQEANWDRGSGPIFDKEGKQIGQMEQKLISLKKEMAFKEMNGQVVAKLMKKLLSAKTTYELFDASETILAKIEKAPLSLKPKFEIKDSKGKTLYTSKGNFSGFDFKIFKGDSDKDKDMIAEIHKMDKWKDAFFGGKWDKKDTYGVKIHDGSVDRRLILGLTITIDNTLHDK